MFSSQLDILHARSPFSREGLRAEGLRGGMDEWVPKTGVMVYEWVPKTGVMVIRKCWENDGKTCQLWLLIYEHAGKNAGKNAGKKKHPSIIR